MKAIGLTLGVVGMLIGCYSAWFGLTKGSGSSGLAGFAIAALVLALGAGVAPLVLRRLPVRAGLVMIVCGALGYGASAFYSTRTLYFVALVCWILGAGALLLASRQRAAANS